MARTNRDGITTFKAISFEHQVGSFAFTMLKHVFNDPKWVITPEMFDSLSGKNPDITIEEPMDDRLVIHAAYRLKKHEGGRFEDAVHQTVKGIIETVDRKGNQTGSFDVFLIVQQGLEIAFFEYHNDRTNLDGEEIQHFMGCTSLTQEYNSNPAVVQPTGNVKNLFHNFNRLRNQSPVRKEAAPYNIPCVFKHWGPYKGSQHSFPL